jgi:hypothetical protein
MWRDRPDFQSGCRCIPRIQSRTNQIVKRVIGHRIVGHDKWWPDDKMHSACGSGQTQDGAVLKGGHSNHVGKGNGAVSQLQSLCHAHSLPAICNKKPEGKHLRDQKCCHDKQHELSKKTLRQNPLHETTSTLTARL